MASKRSVREATSKHSATRVARIAVASEAGRPSAKISVEKRGDKWAVEVVTKPQWQSFWSEPQFSFYSGEFEAEFRASKHTAELEKAGWKVEFVKS